MPVTEPISQSSAEQIDKKRSWLKFTLELFVYAAIFASLFLIPQRWWLSYFEFRNTASNILFVEHWLPSVVVAFALLAVGLLFEYRAYRLHRKLTYLTPLRLAFVVAAISLFVFVQANGT